MNRLDTTALQTALTDLGGLVRRAGTRAQEVDHDAADRRRRLLWHLDEYLLARVRDLEAPLVVVLLGSTGAGKSSLLNGLARRRVSAAGVTRPTTRKPVMLVAPADAQAVHSGRVLRALAESDRLDLVVDPGAVQGLALVDAPDLDSVEAANRTMADELLQAADLCLFVTTAQRYADAAPWDYLHRAAARGVPLVVVVNRLPAGAGDREAVLADCRRRFEEAGLAGQGPQRPLEVIPIDEGAVDPQTDGLTPQAVAQVDRALSRIASDRQALAAVKAQALVGALAGLPEMVAAVARDVETEERRRARLLGVVADAYADEQRELAQQLGAGEFLRGQVMRSWQEFVGVREVSKLLATGVGRVRRWVVGQLRPQAAVPLMEARDRAFGDLEDALIHHADTAAGTAATQWSADPFGAMLLAEHPGLWGHGGELPRNAADQLQGWLNRLTAIVEERGQSRRAFAVAASLGVNAIGIVAMLAVFAHSAGLTGGEVAIAGGTAVVNQKLLEALFGEAAVVDIIRAAERDLRSTLKTILDEDGARFENALGAADVHGDDLRGAAEVVRETGAAVVGELGRA